MAYEMRGPIAVENRHLAIHKNDMWHSMRPVKQIIKSLFAIPYCSDLEAEFLDRFDSDLLVDSAGPISELVFTTDCAEFTCLPQLTPEYSDGLLRSAICPILRPL